MSESVKATEDFFRPRMQKDLTLLYRTKQVNVECECNFARAAQQKRYQNGRTSLIPSMVAKHVASEMVLNVARITSRS